MINKWEQYYPGEKVRAKGKGNEREGVCRSLGGGVLIFR